MPGSFILFFFILFEVNSFTLSNIPKTESYFEVIIDRIEVVKETPGFGEWHLKVRKVNKTRLVFGYMNFHINFGDNIMIEYKCLKKQGGEYRYLPFSVSKQPYCQWSKTDQYFYPDIAKDSDCPEQSELECPTGIKEGNYSFNGVALSLGEIPKTFLHTGEYAAENIFYLNDDIVSHYKIYGYINSI